MTELTRNDDKIAVFKCHASMEFKNMICRVCFGVLHPSCLKRDFKDGVIIDNKTCICSKQCKEQYDKEGAETEKLKDEINQLKAKIKDEQKQLKTERKMRQELEKKCQDLEDAAKVVPPKEQNIGQLEKVVRELQNEIVHMKAEMNQALIKLDNKIEDSKKQTIEQPYPKPARNTRTSADNHNIGLKSNNKNISVNHMQSTSENGKSPVNTISLEQVQQAMQEVTKELESHAHNSNQDNDRTIRATNKRQTNRKASVFGRAKAEDAFRGIPTKNWFYVGRVDPSVSKEGIKTYISSKLSSNDISVEKLESKSQYSVAFKVGIESSFHEQVNSPEFWPEGVTFRKYIFSKQNRNFREGKNIQPRNP